MRIRILKSIALILLTGPIKSQTQIPPSFFGLNYWLTDYTNAPFGSVQSFTTQVNTYNSNTNSKLMRVGGTGYNLYKALASQFPCTNQGSVSVITPAGYVRIVDDVRFNGYEPMIQVPYDDYNKTKGLEQQAAEAAEIVRTVNIIHNRNVKYWIIGNEPTDNYGYADPMGLAENRLVSTYIKKYSVEMKKIDPSIKIVGPELTSTYTAGLSPLFACTSSISITGSIGPTFDGVATGAASVASFVDYASFHSYPGFSGVFTGTLVPRQKYVDGAFDIANEYQTAMNIFSLSCNDHISLMVDEFNMLSAASGSSALSATSIPQESLNANTFLAGQLVADMVGAMLTATRTATTTPYQNCNLWSCVEGKDIGYIDNSTFGRKPTYWHYWMMANFFKGDFYKNVTIDPGQGNIGRCYRAYACKGPDYIAVLVINQATTGATPSPITNTTGASQNFTIDFNGQAATFSFSMGVANPYNGSIPNKSTSLYFFDCGGNYKGQYDVTEAAMTASPTTFTPQAAPGSTIPVIPTLTITGNNGCYGSTATITAGSSVTWYIGPDYVNSYTTAVSFTTSTPGIYAARITGSCNNYWLTAVINQTTPIISPLATSTINCGGGANAQLSLSVTAGASIAWSPTLGLSCGTCTNPTAGPTGTGITAYGTTVTAGSCSVAETISVSACTASMDLFMYDCPSDPITEPENICPTYVSYDLYISQSYSLQGTSPYPGQNAEYKTNGDPNYVHVIVRNNGTQAAAGILKVYWTKAAISGGLFSQDWLNALFAGTSVPRGDQIGSPITVSVAGTSSTEIVIPWVVPDPSIYNFGGYFDASTFQHFCLYARIETGCGMAVPETSFTPVDVLNNNNITQRNITVVNSNSLDAAPPHGHFYNLLCQNTQTVTRTHRFAIIASANTLGETMLSYGYPQIRLNDDLYSSWQGGGSSGTNVVDMGSNMVLITGTAATIDNVTLTANQLTAINANFKFTSQAGSSENFEVDVQEYDVSGSSPQILGGEKFIVVAPACPTVTLVNSDISIDLGCSATLEVSSPDANAGYTWYDGSTGSFLANGYSVSVSPTVSSSYYVEGALFGCVQYAYASVNVSTVDCGGGRMAAPSSKTLATLAGEDVTFGVRPNPTSDQATISYDVEGIEQAEISISNSYGALINKFPIDTTKKRVTLNCGDLKSGLYYVTLITGNKITKTVKLIVMK